MKTSKLIWADLSTYDPKSSLSFYQNVFGWEFHNDRGYWIATLDGQAVAGIYETPAFFKKIKMPHFWMSYFQVDDTTTVVQKSEKTKGKVELSDQDFQSCLLYTSPSPRDATLSRMPSSA